MPQPIVVSMSTAFQRLMGRPRACRVTPEEYRSMLLMANNWTMATTRNGTRNQLLKACGKLLKGSLLSIWT